jgi:hypothetical protein
LTKEYIEATKAIPRGSDMFQFLRKEKFGKADSGKAILLRCPSTFNFIELSRAQYDAAVDEFERACTVGIMLGETLSPLQRIGAQMLLGHDFDYFARCHA